VLDVVKTSGRQNPMVLLQPSPRLQDVFPSMDLSNAAKLNHQLPNLDSAYVGVLEETGSLFAMSSDHFPLVAFGDANPNSMHPLIDPPPGTPLPTGGIPRPNVDEITKARKLRELCDKGAFDPRCLTGIRKLESSSRSRLSRLLDAAPVPQVPQSATKTFPTPSSIHDPGDNRSLVNILSPWPHGQAPGQLQSTLPLWLLVLLSSTLGWIMIGRRRWKSFKLQIPPQPFDIHYEAEPKYLERTSLINAIAPEQSPNHLESHEANNEPTADDASHPRESTPVDETGESEKEDPIATPTRKKQPRRRRGKKKKGLNLTTPADNDEPEGETETDVAEEGPTKIQLFVSTPVTAVTPSPALIVSEEVLGTF
jgi:serine/threonine-protein kinase/endoribonuclease IRE1